MRRSSRRPSSSNSSGSSSRGRGSSRGRSSSSSRSRSNSTERRGRDKGFGQTFNIQVVVRVRPAHGDPYGDIVKGSLEHTDTDIAGYRFNGVFGPEVGQQAVFASAVNPVVDHWFDGYNASIFAYGQTGSGKTHTMLGPEGGRLARTAASRGVVPRVAAAAFRRIALEQAEFSRINEQQHEALSQFQIRLSYVELYNDTIVDLLSSEGSQRGISLREDAEGVVYVEGAIQHPVGDVEEVMSLIARAARARTTHSTGMNHHSSRSHAVCTLHLEHRWRQGHEADHTHYQRSTSTLQLVDLAGSEYQKKTGNSGDRLRESAYINTGLFTLSKVIAALGQASQGHARNSQPVHIPYRDSLISRLLQPSLGGDSRTLMIACVGPEDSNRDETLSTLKFASGVRVVENSAVKHVEDIFEEDMWACDVPDPDSLLNRRCEWIHTDGWGSVYARCVGDPEDDLVLFVHGSGPTNSSAWWNGMVHEMAVTTSTPYFMVAIDCPGYGRSEGDRQTIRSYPAQFLRAVVNALGKSNAACLVGSSQGSCAVFNAVLEDKGLAAHVAVMDPVGHDVFRYKSIEAPCLLTFDTEDAGHPVKVGRWMKANLPNCTYHEFAASREPYWHADHFVTEIRRLLEPHAQRRGSSKSKDTKVARTRLAGGLVQWSESDGWGDDIKQIDDGLLRPPSEFIDELRAAAASLSSNPEAIALDDSLWRSETDPRSGRVRYRHLGTGEVTTRAPVVFRNTEMAPSRPVQEDLFGEDVKAAAAAEEDPEERRARELGETGCGHCGRLLWNPVRLSPCRHAVCSWCHRDTSAASKRCAVCGEAVRSSAIDDEHQLILNAHIDAPMREEDVMEDARRHRAALRIVISYGNTAREAGKGESYAVTAYAKCAKIERGPMYKGALVGASAAIARVDFDINPDYPGSAVKVTSRPFELSRTMALAFTCAMTVHFAPALGIPPVRIPYRIHHDLPDNNFRIVVTVNGQPQAKAHAKKALVVTAGRMAPVVVVE